MWYIYVLRSTKNGRLYTGSTNDLERRLGEHQRGHSKYTKHAGPFELVYREEYDTQLEARRRELYLKTGHGREELAGLMEA
jgi:putative endonuclease